MLILVGVTINVALNGGLFESATKAATETQKEAEMLAEKHGIKQSGGSDFHGDRKKHISLGTGMGNLAVPFEFYENLKK